jgi:O-antigen ligase
METWLKGGIIGAAIYIFFFILPINLLSGELPKILNYLTIFLSYPWVRLSYGTSDAIRHFLFYISALFNFFLVGAVIGLIIQKIKSKKPPAK